MVKILSRKPLTIDEYKELCVPDMRLQYDLVHIDDSQAGNYNKAFIESPGGLMAHERGVLNRILFPQLFEAVDELCKEHGLNVVPIICLRNDPHETATYTPFFANYNKHNNTVILSSGFLELHGLMPRKNSVGVLEASKTPISDDAKSTISHELIHQKYNGQESFIKKATYATSFALPFIYTTWQTLSDKTTNMLSKVLNTCLNAGVGYLIMRSIGDFASNFIGHRFEDRADVEGMSKVKHPVARALWSDRNKKLTEAYRQNLNGLQKILTSVNDFFDLLQIRDPHPRDKDRIAHIEKNSGEKLEDYKANNPNKLVEINFAVDLAAAEAHAQIKNAELPKDLVIEPDVKQIDAVIEQYRPSFSEAGLKALEKFRKAVEDQRAFLEGQSLAPAV